MSEVSVHLSAGQWIRQIAEHERAAFLAGVRAGLEAAANMAATYAPEDGYDDMTIGGRAAMQAGDNISAAIRALDAEAIAKEAAEAVRALEDKP